MRFARTKNRVYPSDAHRKRRTCATSQAEYGVVDGERTLARIVFNAGKWIALDVSSGNGFGRPVSPVNYVLLRDVKEWAMRRFGAIPDSG